MAAVLHEIEESDNHAMFSQTDNEFLALGLKEDVAKEEPITVTEDDLVIITSKDTDDATRGTSVENTSEIVDDCKNMDTADTNRLEMPILALATSVESDNHVVESDADIPRVD
jgi:hypothetical protein